MKKRITFCILSLVLIILLSPTVFAVDNNADTAAQSLYNLGLFNGTGTGQDGTPIFDLDRAPTRHEAVTMLVRLLGKSKEAENNILSTPFSDVATWAKPYVGYAYTYGLTSGTSASTYSGDDTVTASQYLSFVLRALGYTSGSDFQWDRAWELSDRIGLTAGQYNSSSTKFTRGDIAQISKAALTVSQKNTDTTLAEQLLNNATIDMGAALIVGVAPNTEKMCITIAADTQGYYSQNFEDLASVIPNAKYSCSTVLPKNAHIKNLDDLIASSSQMSSLLCNKTPETDNFGFSSYALEEMTPIMLIFSDMNTLCAYMIGQPTKLDNYHLQAEFVLCNYSFSKLTQALKAEYANVHLPKIDMSTNATPQMSSFLPYSIASDPNYIENNIDTIVCNMWLQHRIITKSGLFFFDYHQLPISSYEAFKTSVVENWKTYTYDGTMATTYLILDDNNTPIGYTIEQYDLSAQS